jgi:hypothetical protein
MTKVAIAIRLISFIVLSPAAIVARLPTKRQVSRAEDPRAFHDQLGHYDYLVNIISRGFDAVAGREVRPRFASKSAFCDEVPAIPKKFNISDAAVAS